MQTTKWRFIKVMAIGALIFLAGCVQTPERQSDEGGVSAPLRAQLEPLGGFFEQNFKPNSTQSRLVFYQAAQEGLMGATGVFVDGRYHASVVGGAWSQLCYSPGAVQLGARQMQVGQQAKDLMDSLTTLNLVGGQTQYVRIDQANGRPLLKPVSLSQALREIEGSRQQMHSLSRVAQECRQPAEGTPVSPSSTESSTLTAQVLFEFDRSDPQAMTRASLESIDAALLQLRSSQHQIERVHVIGHADPLGKPVQNERLSQERAQTVRLYLQNRLPDGVRVSAESRGASEPLVQDCDKVATPRSIACNALNRRVVVLISGSPR